MKACCWSRISGDRQQGQDELGGEQVFQQEGETADQPGRDPLKHKNAHRNTHECLDNVLYWPRELPVVPPCAFLSQNNIVSHCKENIIPDFQTVYVSTKEMIGPLAIGWICFSNHFASVRVCVCA